MKVAMLAPPWIPVPPPGYGGIEQVLALLAAELTERGNHVTLFAAPGTESRARVLSPLEGPHPDEIEMSLYEADHVASAFARMEQADPPFDILHDHCGFTAFAFADRIDTPVLHTLHGPFTEETSAFYARHGHKACAVALSRYQARQAPDELEVVAVIGNPMVVDDFPFRQEKDGYLLWIGRMNDDKDPTARSPRLRRRGSGSSSPGRSSRVRRSSSRARWSRTSTGTGFATSARSGRRRATCTPAPARSSCRSAGRSRSAS
jgi:hypothetical protein